MTAKKHEFNSITVSKRGVTTGIGARRACIVEPKIQNSQFQTYLYLVIDGASRYFVGLHRFCISRTERRKVGWNIIIW